MYNELKLNIQSKPVSSIVGNFSFSKEIQISGLSFNYPDTKKKTLDNISFAINYGQTVGIIGPSGSGKSTLVDVILGLLTPTGGSIEVDNKDIATSMRGWQNLIGYVPQTVFLSDDTLRRNIAFGIPDEEIDNEAVRKAVKYAQLEEYVSTLDLGIDAFVGERGVRISGGQRQRIGIARALYHNPSVLVLDEATSSLDNETERGVMESIIALQGSKTILIVAHRLTTVQHCDKIFRIQHGKLVEAGTPKEIFETINKN
jgi:ABC-type multidrug transport system fused ATPase/permease subunit